jgi:methanogenic corrinoid protein MtbC1
MDDLALCLDRTRQRVLAGIVNADPADAVAALQEFASAHGAATIPEHILLPMLSVFTRDHADSPDYPMAKAYVAGIIAEQGMALAGAELPAAAGRRGPVVLGNVEDDFHALGRVIVANFLRADGWEVLDLGNDVEAATFVATAIERRAPVIGASAMLLSTARNVRLVRDELERRGQHGRIALAVGGAIFALRPELAAEVGGDGTCTTAMGASALCQRLCAQAGVAP